MTLALLALLLCAADVPLDIEDVPLDELLVPVVSASRYEQPQRDAPSAVSIVTADEIARFGWRTLDDVLRGLRSVHMAYDRQYTYVGVRGFGLPGDYNTRLLLLVDGHRVNEAIYDSFGADQQLVIDVQTIDHVELVRGPSSSVHGTNAFFGVVNVVTKRGAAVDGARARVRVGSFGSGALALEYGDAYDSGLDVYVAASGGRSDGQALLYFSDLDAPETSGGIARDLDGERWTKVFTSAAYAGFELRAAYASRAKDVPTGAWGTAFGAPGFTTTDTFAFADASYRHDFGDGPSLLARAYLDRYIYAATYPYEYREDPAEDPLVVMNRDEVFGTRLGGELQLRQRVFDAHTLLAGVEYFDQLQQDQANFDVDPRTSYLDRRDGSRQLGAYLQAEGVLLEGALVLNAGLRWDHGFDGFGTALNPRLAIIVHPWDDGTVKLLGGTAFRAPNAYERFYSYGDPEDGFAELANPTLGAEHIETVELVVEQGLGANMHVLGAGYGYRVRDLVRLVPVGDDDVQFQNQGEVFAIGGELEVRASYGGARAHASYSLQLVRDVDLDQPLPNSPEHLGKLGVSVPFASERFWGSFEAFAVGRRRTVSGAILDPHALLNLSLLAASVLDGLDVSLAVRNLLDTSYADPASEEHVQSAIPQDGRTFWLELSYAVPL